MNNIITENAYGILGLNLNATQKEISKRVRDIEKLLKIGEVPSYDYDFGFYDKRRDEKSIKEAINNLSKKQVLHSFFRIHCETNEQNAMLQKLQSNLCNGTLSEILDNIAESKQMNANMKRNMAIILSMDLLATKRTISIIKATIDLWKEIVSNSKCLQDFQKTYLLYDEMGLKENAFRNLKEQILDEIIIIFGDIAKLNGNEIFLGHLIKTFNLQDIKLPQIENIYKQIDKEIQKLDSMDISADGVFDDDERNTIKNSLSNILNSFEKLKKLDLYETTSSKALRDRIVEALRKHSIDLHNNLNEKETCLGLIETSLKIVSSAGLKQELENAYKQVSKNIAFQPIFDTLKSLENNMASLSYSSLESKLQNIKNTLNNINDHDETRKIKDSVAIRLANATANLFNMEAMKLGIRPDADSVDKALLVLRYAKNMATNPQTIDDLAQEESALQKLQTIASGSSSSSSDTAGDTAAGLVVWIVIIVIGIVIFKACS